MIFFANLLREIRINYFEWKMYRSTGIERVRWWSRMKDEIKARDKCIVARMEKKKGLV